MSDDPRPLLGRLPGCASLDPAAREALAQAARLEVLAPATVLVAQGQPAPDWFGIVESGTLRLAGAEAGPGPSPGDLGPGDVLDPGPPGAPAGCSVVAAAPTRCWLVPQAAVARHRSQAGTDPTDASPPHPGTLAPFVRRVRDLMTGPPVVCRGEAAIGEAARLMTARGVGSVVVVGDDDTPRGIVTDRDLRSRVVAGDVPSSAPVTAIMSAPLLSVPAGALAFDALLEMTRRNIHHLGVTEEGRLLGVVSSHDVMRLQGAHPVVLGREIEGQATVEGLVAVAQRLVTVVRWLAEEGARALDIGRIVAELNDRLVRRAVALTEAALAEEGHGRPPVPYSWLAAGSEGRREQTLRTDQDNGLAYADPPEPIRPAAAAYFERLAGQVGATLVRLGFPLCAGGFMASNPEWCQPVSAWRERFDGWMTNPHPQRVLAACIYFDLRPVAGDQAPGHELWSWVCDEAPGRTLFLRYLARTAAERRSPLGFFGGFVVERSGAHRDQLDLKARGVFPMTMAMRVYALSEGVRETNTVDRLREVAARGIFTPPQVDELRDAYEVVSRLRLAHQLAALDAGREPDNFVNPDTLGRADRLLLKEAFRSLGWLQEVVQDRFQTGLLD